MLAGDLTTLVMQMSSGSFVNFLWLITLFFIIVVDFLYIVTQIVTRTEWHVAPLVLL